MNARSPRSGWLLLAASALERAGKRPPAVLRLLARAKAIPGEACLALNRFPTRCTRHYYLDRVLGPDGTRAVTARNFLLTQQRPLVRRAPRLAPNCSTPDRFLMGLWSLFLRPRHLAKIAVSIRPSTLLRFHQRLVRCTKRSVKAMSSFRWRFKSDFEAHT